MTCNCPKCAAERLRYQVKGDFVSNPFDKPMTATEILNQREEAFRKLRQQGGLDQLFKGVIFGVDTSEPAKPALDDSAVKQYILDYNHNVAWDDVIGNDKAREALRDAIEASKDAEIFAHYGLRPPKGVLLYGPPGCGKTMFAKAAGAAVSAMHGTKAQVLVVNGPQINSMWFGKTEENLRSIFTYAREYFRLHGHPLVVFFDECDTLFESRSNNTSRPSQATVAEMLSQLDGTSELGAFVILATNRPEVIDEALLRDGRIGLKIKIERPSRKAIERIIYNALIGVPCQGLLEDLAFTGAEALFDPARVIHPGHILLGRGNEIEKDVAHNFNLEHIVNGAMAVGVVDRAKLRAFRRDRRDKTLTGVTASDIISAVGEIFEENKSLPHDGALREFAQNLPLEAMLEQHQKKGKLQ